MKWSSFGQLVLVAVLGVVTLATTAYAVPTVMGYTGELAYEDGTLVNEEVGMYVSLHGAAAGGDALWGPVGYMSVPVVDGVFSLFLGQPGDGIIGDGDGAKLAAMITTHDDLWLEFTVNGKLLKPRQKITPVPFALAASDSDRLGGLEASAYLQSKNVAVVATSGNYSDLLGIPQTSPWEKSGTAIAYGGGNVGIGTKAPTAKLHVGGSGVSAGRFEIGSASGSNGGRVLYMDVDMDNSEAFLEAYDYGGNGNFPLSVRGMPVAINNKSLVIGHGKVSVGKALSDYALDVNGTINANEFYQNGSPLTTSPWISGHQSLTWSGGNLGIGVTHPKATLHVGGGVVLGEMKAACTQALMGTLRFDAENQELSLCADGSNWVSLYAKANNWFGDGSDGDLVVNGDVELSSQTDGEMVVLQLNSLDVKAGKLTVSNRCRGLFLYVNGDATINGTISMTARGAKGNPEPWGVKASGLRLGMITTVGSDNWASNEFQGAGAAVVAATGAQKAIKGKATIYKIERDGAGGGGQCSGNMCRNKGDNGGAGQSGGGGSGGCWDGCTTGSGAAGTCFSGGSGGGGARANQGGNAEHYGGAGGTGKDGIGRSGGGAGNPGGKSDGGSYDGANGTGGLLVLVVGGNLTLGPGARIEADGIDPGGCSEGCGGASGGGNILIIHAGALNDQGASITANGGNISHGGNGPGGPGGNGSVQGPHKVL